MARFAVVVALLAVILHVAVGLEGTTRNKLSVKFSTSADKKQKCNFIDMPRTLAAAVKKHFKRMYYRDQGLTSVWCPHSDYHMCLIYDKKGSIAGIQMTLTPKEAATASVPINLNTVPEWEASRNFTMQTYTLTVYFVSKDVIRRGGRKLSPGDSTVPEGAFILQTDSEGREINRLLMPIDQEKAVAPHFALQGCGEGQGIHYNQNRTPDTPCEEFRPYFVLYSSVTKKLVGFVFSSFGEVPSAKQDWFDLMSIYQLKKLAPRGPNCLVDWAEKYTLFTSHVYFIQRPWELTCPGTAY
ncbi:uncharacterized protein LOC117639575 [Thrips palmi]|uniref:Uncharacterized protein LOC117639575 n=1 Tax=Thrips palmi TaxID=161013 RepID=A0A6P8Y4D3_THRPL|nr:uncharacterized protein LOC117639575 [Thrips palmi]